MDWSSTERICHLQKIPVWHVFFIVAEELYFHCFIPRPAKIVSVPSDCQCFGFRYGFHPFFDVDQLDAWIISDRIDFKKNGKLIWISQST